MAQRLSTINRKMVDAIEQMKTNSTPELENEVFGELANNAKFVVPVRVSGTASETQPENPDDAARMQFPVLRDKQGRVYFMAFTDKTELKKWAKDYKGETTELMFDAYGDMVLGNEQVSGFVINPFSSNLVVGRKMIEYLQMQKRATKRGMHAESLSSSKTVFSAPKEMPEALLDAVKAYMQGNAGIEEAYIRMMNREGEEDYAIIVSFAGDLDEVFGAIMEAAKPHLNGKRLALIPASAASARKAVADAAPFYVKPLRVV